MAAAVVPEILDIEGREVTVTNPGKVLFPDAGYTKLDVVRYYLAVAEGALRGAGGRPNVLVRYPNGIGAANFFQKRVGEHRPDWIEVVTIAFPSGRTAEEIVPRDAAALAWMANLGCIELHPHPVLAEDLDHPNELRVDLDPVPGIEWPTIREVAHVVHDVLTEYGLVGWPKTSGSRGMHVNVRLERRWNFDEVRRAAVALAREVERRAPRIASSKWWKEERHGVFLDYNQNAKDRTVAAAYSVRPRPDARVSAPLSWGEVGECDPADFTLVTMPARFAKGDPHTAIDEHPCRLDALLELAERQAADGLGEAPWPPHYKKQLNEPPRVQPSKRRTLGAASAKTGAARATTGTGRRTPSSPLIEIGHAWRKEDALAGFERWKKRHSKIASYLEPADVLVDSMRGKSTTWTRVRVNLQHVPPALQPKQGKLDPDEDVSTGKPPAASVAPHLARSRTRRTPSRARTES